MRKYIFIFGAILLGAIACNDIEEVSKTEPTADFSSIAMVTNTYPFDMPTSNIDYSSISNYQGRLRFSTHNDVINTIKDLETQYSLWNDAFNQYYGDLPVEELDSIDEEIQFNDELPAETFESTLNFSSLRDNIEQQVSVWLEDDELDEENDPEDHFIVDDEYRTVLNQNSEIIVGDTVFKLFSNGYIKIYDENGSLPTAINVTDDIHNGNLDPFDTTQSSLAVAPGVVVVVVLVAAHFAWRSGILSSNAGSTPGSSNPPPPGTTPSCDVKTLKSEIDFVRDGDRRIKWFLQISNFPWGNNALAKIKGFKKRKRNGWKKYKSYLAVRCHGNMREKFQGVSNINSCVAHPFDNTQNKKAKRLKAVGVDSGISTAEKHDVKGVYNGAGGISTSQSLDW